MLSGLSQDEIRPIMNVYGGLCIYVSRLRDMTGDSPSGRQDVDFVYSAACRTMPVVDAPVSNLLEGGSIGRSEASLADASPSSPGVVSWQQHVVKTRWRHDSVLCVEFCLQDVSLRPDFVRRRKETPALLKTTPPVRCLGKTVSVLDPSWHNVGRSSTVDTWRL